MSVFWKEKNASLSVSLLPFSIIPSNNFINQKPSFCAKFLCSASLFCVDNGESKESMHSMEILKWSLKSVLRVQLLLRSAFLERWLLGKSPLWGFHTNRQLSCCLRTILLLHSPSSKEKGEKMCWKKRLTSWEKEQFRLRRSKRTEQLVSTAHLHMMFSYILGSRIPIPVVVVQEYKWINVFTMRVLPSSFSPPGFLAAHDVTWYGISFWSV